MPPRLVRRAPLSERVKAYLDPWDWLMWASEELNSNDWEDFAKSYATSLGVGMNVLFMIARANAGRPSGGRGDDVFGEVQKSGSGWFKWFMGLFVVVLSTLSFLNGFYTFYRKRHYRLFEQPIETNPATPSAQRVRVDSSPMAASPLRFLHKMIASTSADSRAHPDAARDVWEIAVWDPNPLCLQLFCLFSPLHVVLYHFNLPVAALDPQPSVKVVTTIAIAAILSLQLYYLRTSFSQQTKDSAIIHRAVVHEYDNKFVHPAMQRPSRDVGIQTISKNRTRDSSVGVRGSSDDLASEVVTYTPTTVINRGFRTNPNQVYSSQYDPDNLSSQPNPRALRSSVQTPSLRPSTQNSYYTSSTATGADFSSPIRPSNTPNPFRQPPSQLRPSASGDGGSLGVYSHAASPLRKSASANYLRDDRNRDSLGGAGEKRAGNHIKREGSPLKRMSTPSGFVGAGDAAGTGERPTAADRFGRSYGGLGVGRRESGRF
ncbi:hypothetical protein K505DRAFT_324665 [Melanomma pulvis-pyrius CBS 109.77]|uniref:DUF2418 domain-containing protein n=1 Tax=Melanomma pulvis-pyrius CBS 109.77 TaxID=1314802 RepID=A0A6A6XE73_9PLEO|nr:hypothetical protein K505DRAFT_324665 [Melanomma pulvis-pyrius CBS 109.77]